MTAVKLTLEYDGIGFSGWAAQPGLRTVEGALRAALETVMGGQAALSVAGRTDAGVHAWGQVASFPLEEGAGRSSERLLASLNGLLPPDVSVIEVENVPEGFDARRDARSRTYCYRVLARAAPSPFERGRALWARGSIDEDRLAACARALVGAHDFTAFTPAQTDHVRFDRHVMRSEWKRVGDILQFWIEADAFMRQMVRVLVGTMLDVSAGRRDVEDFVSLLEGAPRAAAGRTAEPGGLYLAAVSYPG